MLVTFSRSKLVAKTILMCMLTGVGWMLQGASFDHARDLVARVQDDLQRAADFTRNNEKERSRYENVQHHLQSSIEIYDGTTSIRASWIRPSTT